MKHTCAKCGKSVDLDSMPVSCPYCGDQPFTPADGPLDLGSIGLTPNQIQLLATGGIKTLEDLCSRTKDQLLEIYNLGPSTAKQIEKKLENHGLALSKTATTAKTSASSKPAKPQDKKSEGKAACVLPSTPVRSSIGYGSYGYWGTLMPGEDCPRDGYRDGPCLGRSRNEWSRHHIRVFFVNSFGSVNVVFTDKSLVIPPQGERSWMNISFSDFEKEKVFKIFRSCAFPAEPGDGYDEERRDICNDFGISLSEANSIAKSAEGRRTALDCINTNKEAIEALPAEIPLNKISAISFVESGSYIFHKPSTTYTVEKSVIPGALVGGLVAGPAGAVVGAISQKGKTTTKSFGGLIDTAYTYDLVFTLEGEERFTYRINDVWSTSVAYGQGGYSSKQNFIFSPHFIWVDDGMVTPEGAEDYIRALIICAKEGRAFGSSEEKQRVAGISRPATSSSSPSSPSSASSGGCYVATAVYGSYDCPEVWTLRRFRDYDLAETWYGRAFIKIYYAISPTLVRWFGETEWFKRMWRGRLDALVRRCKARGHADTPYEDRVW